MDWIFDNIQIIVIVAAGIASILSQRRKSKLEQEAEENLPPPIPMQEDEDLRKVREEIARKRAEREGQVPPGPPDGLPRPYAYDRDQDQDQAPGLDEYMQPEPTPEPARPPSRSVDMEEMEAQLARQRELQERVAALAQQRAQAVADNKAARVAVYATKAAAPAEMVMTHGPASTLPRLKAPGELRRAIIYREVLGPPKSALR